MFGRDRFYQVAGPGVVLESVMNFGLEQETLSP